jgi:hypothetical protein
MNLILEKDGIPAFIGTKSEFGLYQAKFIKRHEEGIPPCWISCPDHTILSMLGLCRIMEIPGKPEVAFYGSPLTLMLSVMLNNRDDDWLLGAIATRSNLGLPIFVSRDGTRVVTDHGLPVFPVEYQRALSYYKELHTPFGPQQTGQMYIGLSTLRIC